MVDTELLRSVDLFAGFTPDLLCVVWIGFDDNTPTGLSGARAALPLWVEFMKAAHPPTPAREFETPADVYFVRATGDKGLPARPGTPGSVLLPFKRGTLPSQFTKVARAVDRRGFTDDVF